PAPSARPRGSAPALPPTPVASAGLRGEVQAPEPPAHREARTVSGIPFLPDLVSLSLFLACLPTCICNLHSGSCDINCCCDTDCNLGCDLGDSRAAFSFCLPGTKLNYFQQPQNINKSDFSVFLAQYGRPSFIPPSQDQPSSSAFYRAGDPIQTYFAASSVLSTLRQPVGMGASGLCIDGNPAGFLESKSTSCTRTFTNLSSSCTTDPTLDAASYYRNFTILKVRILFPTLSSFLITPVTQPGAPQMDGNTCHNVVSEVIYEIEFSGTHGIQNVSVQLKVTNISGNSLQQRFTLQFWVSALQSRTPSYTLPRSGSPGYIMGAPLLSLNKLASSLLQRSQTAKDVFCLISSISQTTEDGNCSYFQEKLYQALQGVSSPQALAIIGSAEPTQTDQWSSIIIRNCSMQAGHCASCCMVPVSLKIQVLWAEVGLQSNPQSQVLGARYWYQCQSLKSLSMTMVPLTTVVAFTDMTEWPEPPRSQPSTYWKLPFDFFFPFKIALNGGVSGQGDLAAAFLMSLAFCSILSF
uniref:Tectonic family member 3 n=1 Tax=Chelydra serpentina TaxID=8475 RepID=A0A8C3SFF8_CHESE